MIIKQSPMHLESIETWAWLKAGAARSGKRMPEYLGEILDDMYRRSKENAN